MAWHARASFAANASARQTALVTIPDSRLVDTLPPSLAPIALFAYKRPGHLRRTLEALRRDPLFERSPVHVYCDGARAEADLEAVEATRQVARELATPSTRLVLREHNLGLRRSIVAGVGELTEASGRVIVVEDDLIVGPQFLGYMNAALERYRDHDRVFQVSGHMFPVSLQAGPGPVFLPFTTTWGWATWKRAWQHFDGTAAGMQRLQDDRRWRRRFDIDGSYPYFRMLQRQRAGEIDSWGILWYLSVFLRDGLVVFPRRSLVANEGFEGSGTHCTSSSGVTNTTVDWAELSCAAMPEEVRVDDEAYERIRAYLAATGSVRSRLMRRVSGYLERARL